MSRNGSGTYTKAVSSFSPGGTITASDHNSLWDDLVTEITNSVAADGQTTVTGPIKFADGDVSAPGLTFAADTDSGIYRAALNRFAFAAGGAQVAIFASASCSFQVPLTMSATATFRSEAIFSATAVFTQPILVSGTATFTKGFIASATASFVEPILCSGTATFTKGFITSATAVFTQPILCSGTATFTKGFIASATSTFTITPVGVGIPRAIGVATYVASAPTLNTANSFNMASITDTNVGQIRFDFTNNMADANYCVVATAETTSGPLITYVITKQTSGFTVRMTDADSTFTDPASISVVVF